MSRISLILITLLVMNLAAGGALGEPPPLTIATFAIDASPPVGSPMAYDITERVESPLSCRGIVLWSDQQPVVLCAVDWIGIGGEGHAAFRAALAQAAGTSADRVALHCIHQHDAPHFDQSSEKLLAERGLSGKLYNVAWARQVIKRAAEAVRQAGEHRRRVTHLGLGKGNVEKVASNRRILGPDGKVQFIRWSSCTDPTIRAMPEGLIDPYVWSISFFDENRPLAVLTYYATHPQSYYRTAAANPDFPGMARSKREDAVGALHVHFNGAGGNITAGKYNDGSHQTRPLLARRLAAGMAAAWGATEKAPITAADLSWSVVPVVLPMAKHVQEEQLVSQLNDAKLTVAARAGAARRLALLRRCQQGLPIDIACLGLGRARVLHMPGELFVEYQLAAQAMRPDLLVAMAAYGDYAPGYIGTEISYSQGGYETGPNASPVAPEVEGLLIDAMRQLLKAPTLPRE